MVSVKVVGPKGEPGVTEKQPSYLPISMEVVQYFNNHHTHTHTHTHTFLRGYSRGNSLFPQETIKFSDSQQDSLQGKPRAKSESQSGCASWQGSRRWIVSKS